MSKRFICEGVSGEKVAEESHLPGQPEAHYNHTPACGQACVNLKCKCAPTKEPLEADGSFSVVNFYVYHRSMIQVKITPISTISVIL